MALNINDVRLTEYNIQHIAHNSLSQKYGQIIGEVKVKLPDQRGARFDLVVFDEVTGDAMFTVEIKRTAIERHSKARHYELIAGVPNYLIAGIDQAARAVEVIEEQMVLKPVAPAL